MKKPKITYKLPVSVLLKDLPDWVKDHANYMKIERALLDTLTGCRKAHSEVTDISKCKKCTENMLVRRKLMETFGFKSPGVYYAWKKTHHKITKLVPLQKYNT